MHLIYKRLLPFNVTRVQRRSLDTRVVRPRPATQLLACPEGLSLAKSADGPRSHLKFESFFLHYPTFVL